MADKLAQGMAWLTQKLSANCQPIVYQRGTVRIALCAIFGRKQFNINDGEGGFRIEWTDCDFLIPAGSLILSGEETEPQRGDIITVIRTDQTLTYEVRAPGGETPWTWCDPYEQMMRIHGKLMRQR